MSDAAAVDPPAAAPLTPSERPAPLLSNKLAWAGIFLSGFLYYTAFPPLDFWPAALLVWFPFRVALEGRTPKQALKMGLVSGTVMVFLGFYWLVGMLQTFSGFPIVACLFFALVVCAFQGGRFAMLSWAFARASARGYNGNLAFTGAFVASELAYPLLFPWYFGACTNKAIVFQQLADLGGPVLVGIPLMLFSLALAELGMARIRAMRAGERSFAATWARASKRMLVVGVGALALQLGYGTIRILQLDAKIATMPTLRVGMVQGNLGLLEKRREPGGALKKHKKATKELAARGAELVVWSESAVAASVEESVAFTEIKRRISADLGVPAIIGTLIWRHGEQVDWMFNTAVSTDKEGNVTARYDKHFLLMFGEYLPFGKQFPILYKWSPHSGRFTQGETEDPLIVVQNGVRHDVTTLICYEDILPGFTNAAVRNGKPELIVNMTNDAWFGDTAQPWEHFALAKSRAIEHRRYLVRSTNSGVSGIIDPLGRVVAQTELFKEQTTLETVHWMSDGTVYEIVGDKLWWLITVAMLLACYVRRPRSRFGDLLA